MRTRLGSVASVLFLFAGFGRAEEAAFPPTEEPSPAAPAATAQSVATDAGGPAAASAPAEPVCPECPSVECPVVETATDADGVFRAFQVLASAEKTQRIVGGVTGLLLGGASLGVVGYLDSEGALSDATPWYILGGVTMGSSLLAFFLPSQIERLAASVRAAESGHSQAEAEQFERAWARLAAERETQRKSGALLGSAIGAAGIGFGVAILAGALDMTEQDRQLYGTVIIGAGSGVLGGSAASYFVPSSMETSYAQYRAARTPASASLSLLPAPGGAAVGVRGAF